jgi:hypothetical protein
MGVLSGGSQVSGPSQHIDSHTDRAAQDDSLDVSRKPLINARVSMTKGSNNVADSLTRFVGMGCNGSGV